MALSSLLPKVVFLLCQPTGLMIVSGSIPRTDRTIGGFSSSAGGIPMSADSDTNGGIYSPADGGIPMFIDSGTNCGILLSADGGIPMSANGGIFSSADGGFPTR